MCYLNDTKASRVSKIPFDIGSEQWNTLTLHTVICDYGMTGQQIKCTVPTNNMLKVLFLVKAIGRLINKQCDRSHLVNIINAK